MDKYEAVKKNEIEFRLVRQEDLHQFLDWGESDDHRFIHYTFTDFNITDIRLWFRSKQRTVLRKLYGFFIGGYLVGFATLKNFNIINRSAEIGVSIDPDFINRGLGEQMIGMHLKNIYNKYPVDTVYLNVATFNHRAINCYHKLGFCGVETSIKAYEYQDNSRLLLGLYPELFGIQDFKLVTNFLNMEHNRNSITKKAYAKINLGLRILGKRADGYHNLSTIMQTIGIYDIITISPQSVDRIELFVEEGESPAGKKNLIYKAAAKLKEKYGLGGMRINLVKRIPVGAGLGGGSADAAATINIVNELFDLGMTPAQKRLLAVELGADVPFLIEGGIAIAGGIGEELEYIEPPAEFVGTHVIVVPGESLSTKEVFERFDAEVGDAPRLDADRGLIVQLRKSLVNDLTSVAVKMLPEIEAVLNLFEELGAVNASMSGSGSSVFGIFDELSTAEIALREMAKLGYEPRLTKMVY